MKRITEAELYNEYALRDKSRAALMSFICGLIGAILCVVVFWLTENYFSDITSRLETLKKNQFQMTIIEREEAEKVIYQKTQQFVRLGTPLFLVANALWMIGAYAWSMDLKRSPSNKLIWKLGGTLVLVTAIACVVAWVILLRFVLQAGANN